jgi:hypothetical protein
MPPIRSDAMGGMGVNIYALIPLVGHDGSERHRFGYSPGAAENNRECDANATVRYRCSGIVRANPIDGAWRAHDVRDPAAQTRFLFLTDVAASGFQGLGNR